MLGLAASSVRWVDCAVNQDGKYPSIGFPAAFSIARLSILQLFPPYSLSHYSASSLNPLHQSLLHTTSLALIRDESVITVLPNASVE